MEQLTKKYGNEIQFIHVPVNCSKSKIMEWFPYPIAVDRWMAIELLPENVDRFLMLDVDILVIGDLGELYHSDFAGKYMIMCQDQNLILGYAGDKNSILFKDWVEKLEAYYKKFKLGKVEEKYGNCGVALVSRDVKKVFNYKQMVDTIFQNKYFLPEQDYLSINLNQYIKFIEPDQYNNLAFGNYKEFEGKVKIIHYAMSKPWNDYRGTFWQDLWVDCAKSIFDMKEILDQFRNSAQSMTERWKRCDRYLSLMEKWMDIRDKGHNVFDRYGYLSVAVYGAGGICRHLMGDLRNSSVECRAIYDRNEKINIIDDIEVQHDLEIFLENITDCEVILVTAISYYEEIKTLLEEKTNKEIVSVENLVEGYFQQ